MENNDINSNIEIIDNPEPTENIGYNLFFAYLTVPLYMINVGFILFSILKDNVPRGLLNNSNAAKIIFFSYLVLIGISFQALNCIYLMHKNLFLSASKGIFVLLSFLISDFILNAIDGAYLIIYSSEANWIQIASNIGLSFSEKLSLVLFLEYYVQKNCHGKTLYTFNNFLYDITFGIGNVGIKYN